MNVKEKEKLNEALSAAGYSEGRIRELEQVLAGKLDPKEWAEKEAAGAGPEEQLRRLLSGSAEQAAEAARAAGLDPAAHYGLLLLELEQAEDAPAAEELLRQLSENSAVFILRMEESSLVLISALSGRKEAEQLRTEAQRTLSTLNTELMCKLRISVGSVAEGGQALAESYSHAKLAMEVMKRFYEERLIMEYSALGLGGLVIDLSSEACARFMEECFGAKQRSKLSEEELQTVSRFFEHGLNISETARDLYLHRNTLVYHLEKIEKKTGLDIRRFDDAVLLRLALMIENRQ